MTQTAGGDEPSSRRRSENFTGVGWGALVLWNTLVHLLPLDDPTFHELGDDTRYDYHE